MYVHIRCTIYSISTVAHKPRTWETQHFSSAYLCSRWNCGGVVSSTPILTQQSYHLFLPTLSCPKKKHMHCISAWDLTNKLWCNASLAWPHGFPSIASLSYRQLKTAKRPSQAMKRNSSCDQSALVQVSNNKPTIARWACISFLSWWWATTKSPPTKPSQLFRLNWVNGLLVTTGGHLNTYAFEDPKKPNHQHLNPNESCESAKPSLPDFSFCFSSRS